MADISAEIAAFRSAMYGEDVRTAMVNLANKVNNESSTAATTVAGYDERLSAAEACVAGFNIWNEKWTVTSGHIISAEYIPVLPNTNYYFKAPSSPEYGIHYYRDDKTLISNRYNAGLFTTPNDCRFIKFEMGSGYGTVYNKDICINVSQPDLTIEPHNGQYIAYDRLLMNYADLLSLKSIVHTSTLDIDNTNDRINTLENEVQIVNNKTGVFDILPTLRNGSVGNKWNENMVSTGWAADSTTIIDDVSSGDIVSLVVTKPLETETNHYVNGYHIFNEQKQVIYHKDVSSTKWYEDIIIPENGAYIAFALAEYDSTNQIITLRTTNFTAGQVKINVIKSDGMENRIKTLEDTVGTDSTRIVHQNNDVLPAVNACGRYGLHSGGSRNTSRNFTMLITTDVHYETENMKSAIDYLNETDAIMCGCCLGDIAAGDYAQTDGTWYTGLVANSNKPFYTIIGNHDGGNSTNASISATVENTFKKWIKPTLNKIGIVGLDVPYYEIDTNYGISIIWLNNYDVPDTMSGSNFAVSRGSEVISQTQVDWLLDTLDNIPAGNHLLVAMHSYPYSNVAVNSVFSQPNCNPTGSGRPAYTELIPDIINSWVTGGSLQKTYTPQISSNYLDSVLINHSFASREAGVFVGYIVGHTHKDIIAKSAIYDYQKIICLTDTAGGTWQNEGSDLPRIDGTKTQDAITVIGIDKNARMIKLVRVGSNITTNMVDRTMTAISY